jgi:hypothetical protein
MPPWDKYRDRYNARPETFEAYVDVWNDLPDARASFGGWVGFAQAANAEPSWVAKHPDRVRTAERLMRKAGYEIGAPTEKGARRWVLAKRIPRFVTLRLFGREISV